MHAVNPTHNEYSAVALLELGCDGTIPPAALARAQAIDAARRRAARPAVRLVIKEWKPAGIIDRMAQRMAEHARLSVTGTVHRRDLIEDGFSPAELDLYGERAKAECARRLAAAS